MKAISILLLPFAMTFLLQPVPKLSNSKDLTAIGKGQMPALAADGKGIIHLVYGVGDSLMYTSSTNKGESFIRPFLISKLDGLNASATRGPQIISTSNGLCVLASTGSGSIYCYTHSSNGQWKKTAKVTDKDSVDLEGFVSLGGDGNQMLFAIWPDVRITEHNKIYGARSLDGGKTWSKNIMIYTSPDSTVCECCKPSVAVNGNNIYVMFRNSLNGNRDLHLIKSTDGGKTFGTAQKLGTGSWPLNGCPMDGGGIALNGNNVQTVWNRKGTIYACEPGKEEKPVGQGRSCTMETVDGKNVYAWTENGQVACLLPNSKMLLGKGSTPVLKAVDKQHVLCVWEHEKLIYSKLLLISK